ncbi:hypothetical protein [Hugenholtzia roseola]|uniref:hypothetical protein n=1 Tax=Hugenholtzia roseola TaxID=1002 RepID=UPI00041353A0|nr:hypothetical protein [Hugenholtzia roseola]
MKPQTAVFKIDQVNILLIFISILIAYCLPFALFLFSYAVLGSLHYLTEIFWLEKRNFFVNKRSEIYPLILFTILLSAAYLLSKNLSLLDYFHLKSETVYPILVFLSRHTLFIAFGWALILVATQKRKVRLVAGLLLLLFAYWAAESNWYLLIFSWLLPTFIHVYIFTLIFMITGAARNRSLWGGIAVLVFLLGSLFLILTDIETPQKMAEMAKEDYFSTDFRGLNQILEDITLYFFNFLNPIENKLPFSPLAFQRLIAFAYTYHYLNWFSKVEIIAWHRVSAKQSLTIGIIWSLSLALYYYDLKVGMMALYFLSLLHVVLEFPLNVKSFEQGYKLFKVR